MGQTAAYRVGRDAGMAWVASQVTPNQLDALLNCSGDLHRITILLLDIHDVADGQDFDLTTGQPTAETLSPIGDAFARVMLDVDGIASEPGTFWQATVGDDRKGHDMEFVHGFIVGAIRSAKDQAKM